MLSGGEPPKVPDWRYKVTVEGLGDDGDVTDKVTSWSADYTLGEPVGSTPIRAQRGEGSGDLSLMAPRESSSITDGHAASPWVDPDWPPRPGAQVQIMASADGGTTWQPAANMLADTPWDDSDGTAGTKLVDRADRLSRSISLPPLLRIMPPIYGQTDNRETALHHCWLVDAAVTVGGWRIGPEQPDAARLLSVSLQGSSWPSFGELRMSGHDNSIAQIETAFQTCAWGRCASGLIAMWKLGVSPDGNDRLTPYSDDWQMTFMVDANHAATATLTMGRMLSGGGTETYIVVNPDRSVSVRHGSTAVASLPGTQIGTVVGLRREGTGWTLWSQTADGVTHSDTGTSAATATYETFMFTGVPGCRIGYIDITVRTSNSTPDLTPAAWEPTAVIGLGPSDTETMTALDATTAIVGSTVGDVLDGVSRAALATYGPNEKGQLVIQSWNNATLAQAATRRTLTAKSDILGKLRRSWSLLDLASQVTITYDKPAWSVSPDYAYTAWQGGGGDTLDAGTTEPTFASCPADQDWVMIDTRFTICDKYTIASRAGHGTMCGGSIVTGKDGDGDDIVTAVESDGYNAVVEQIDFQTVKFTETATGTRGVIRKTPDSKTYPAGWRDRALPLLRVGALTYWTESKETQPVPGAPEDAQSFTWDLGRWVNGTFLQRVFDQLRQFMGSPLLLLEQVSVHPDLRVQIGDLHYLTAPRLGLDLDVVVAGKHLSGGAGGQGLSMTLDLVVTGHRGTPTSWRLWEALTRGRTYEQFETDAKRNGWDWTLLETYPTIIH